MKPLAVKRILVPTDFSVCARAAFLHARQLAETTGAEVVLLRVLDRLPHDVYPYEFYAAPPEGDLYERVYRESQEMLDWIARETFGGLKVRGIVASGPAATTIAYTARHEDADLIVMSTHGWTGFKHWIVGSVAERVVRLAPCPVLTIKPQESAHRTADAMEPAERKA